MQMRNSFVRCLTRTLFFSFVFFRGSPSPWSAGAGALSGGHQSVGDHHHRLPDAPPGLEPQRGVQLCQVEAAHHLAQPQLYGPVERAGEEPLSEGGSSLYITIIIIKLSVCNRNCGIGQQQIGEQQHY